MISKRLAVLTFAAIQSSAITLTNLVFDIASSPFASVFLHEMRDEVDNVLGLDNGSWTKTSISKMFKVDSALRESMRLCGFVSRGVSKMVIHPDGVTLPDGTHVPCGVRVGVSAYSIHHDEAIYPGAHLYDAFRFSESGTRITEDKPATGSRKTTPLVMTSSSFMAFSHGRHSWYVPPSLSTTLLFHPFSLPKCPSLVHSLQSVRDIYEQSTD